MESSTYKIRRSDTPNIPQDAEEAIAVLNNCGEEYIIYLAFVINGSISGEFAFGFMSRMV